jgi:serine protease Do
MQTTIPDWSRVRAQARRGAPLEVITMRKHISIAVALLPLLLYVARAAECSYSGFGESYGYSEEGGTGAYLGVDISDVTSDRVSALKLKDEHGVEVTMVDQDAPAGKAGLKEHDVILTMNGTAVDSGAQLRRMIHETPAGRIVTFGISRDGQPMTVKVQLADKRKASAKSYGNGFNFQMPPMPPMPALPDFPTMVVVHSSARSGLTVENITPQLGDFFGVKDGKGVLIRSVEKGSRADKAGLRAGDVIVRVDDQTIHDTSDFTHSLRLRNAISVKVGVIRDKKEQTITLTLPERKDTGDVFEESVGVPDVNAEADIDLGELQWELADIGPQLELAIQESQEVRKQLPQIQAEAHRATEEARKELCMHQKEMRKAQKEMLQHAREMQRQLQEQQRQWREQQQKQEERLRHELRGEWVEI